MRIAWICVNYCSYPETERFLHSLADHGKGNYELRVFLVDNSPQGESANRLAETLRGLDLDVLCLNSGGNLGYFGGVRYALEMEGQWIGTADWVLTTNVDLELKSTYFLDRLAARDPLAQACVLAPAIRSLRNGRDINPKIIRRPSAQIMAFYAWVFSNYWLHNAYICLSWLKHSLLSQARLDKRGVPHGDRPIYAPHGSCMVFGRHFFASGGDFNYPQFLFNEEIFIAETARTLGLIVQYTPELEIWDFEHTGTGILHNRRIAGWVAESNRFVYETYWKSNQVKFHN